MARLYPFAEGATEQAFASLVLSPHLAINGVYLHKAPLIAHARKHGRVHRGGGRHYPPMANDIRRFLRQEGGSDVYFTTMIDLYALHADFPGQDEAEELRHLPYERVELLERAFAGDIGDQRFIPFIALHEFEALLFAQVGAFAHFYDAVNRAVADLRGIADPPELIDDGPNSAPSKRIIAGTPDYEPGKPVAGPQIAERIGLATIRSKCPHFDRWVTRLEQLGTPLA